MTTKPDTIDALRAVNDSAGRWYVLANDGVATLCANEADALAEAADADAAWPRKAPHRVVQLVPAAQIAAAVAAERARKNWPPGILDRIRSAAQRIDDGYGIRRIPADPSDPDLVLSELESYISGKEPPFWLDSIRAGGEWETCNA